MLENITGLSHSLEVDVCVTPPKTESISTRRAGNTANLYPTFSLFQVSTFQYGRLANSYLHGGAQLRAYNTGVCLPFPSHHANQSHHHSYKDTQRFVQAEHHHNPLTTSQHYTANLIRLYGDV